MSDVFRSSRTEGYSFTTALRPDYLVLCISPRTRRNEGMVYLMTREEVRGLKSCLDILPDPVPE